MLRLAIKAHDFLREGDNLDLICALGASLDLSCTRIQFHFLVSRSLLVGKDQLEGS